MNARRFTFVQIACSTFVVLRVLVSSGCTSADNDVHQPAKVKDAGASGADGGVDTHANEHEKATAVAADGCDAVKLDPPQEGEGIQLSIELALEPGQERQVCRLAKLEQAININWSEGRYSKGSHHGFVTKTSYHGDFPKVNLLDESVEDPTLALECESSGSNWDDKGVIALGRPLGAKNPSVKGLLPEDVAMKLAAGDIVQLNFHMINATEKPLTACYKQNFYSIPDEKVRAEAGTIFWYNPFVTVPANGSSSATMACPITEDVTVADQVSHMHKRGVGYKATLLDGDPLKGGKELQTVYEGKAWNEPPERINTPAMQLKKGQWITFTCDYENPEDRNVAQGQWTTDEMCMFIGTYWPRSPEMDDCYSKGNLIGRNFGTGEKSAGELTDCWKNSPQELSGGGPSNSAARYETQTCITDSCPKASAQLIELLSGKVDPSTVECD